MVKRWRWSLWLGRNFLLLAGILLGLVLVGLTLTPPLLDVAMSNEWLSPPAQRRWFERIEAIHRWLVHGLIGAWIFALGSCLASFLNVVAYRLPRGGSIFGRSQCPRCRRRLSLWDNMPVFGWLRNGGRCASCFLPIPTRYLIVEIVLGSAFLIAFVSDVNFGQLVHALQDSRSGDFQITRVALAAFFSHAILLSLWFLCTLFQLEGARVAWSLVVAGWLTIAAWWIAVNLCGNYWLAGQGEIRELVSPLGVPWRSLSAAVVPLAMALVSGAILPLRRPDGNSDRSSNVDGPETFAFGWLGALLNWPSVLAVGAISAVTIALTRRFARLGQIPFAAVFAALIAAIAWEGRFGHPWARTLDWRMPSYAAALIGFTIVFSLVARRLPVNRSAAESAEPPEHRWQSAEREPDTLRESSADQPTWRDDSNPPSTRGN